MESPPKRSRPLRLRRFRRLRPAESLPKSRGWRSGRGWVFWRGFCWRSEPFALGAVGAVSVVVADSVSLVATGRSLEASAANSPSRSSKSSVGVATVRRERTARETDSAESPFGEESPLGTGSPMIASISEALEARADTSTPFTLAMVWRSSRVLDSRSDRSGEGFTAIGIPFVPLDEIDERRRKSGNVVLEEFLAPGKGRS